MNEDQLKHDPPRALLLIDQPVLGEVARLALSHGHHVTRAVHSVEEAERVIADWSPHLLVVDVDICGHGGLDRLRRAAGPAGTVPVVGLTRRNDLRTKLVAFEHGADDVLTVPFSPEEFVARVLALMRRSFGTATFKPILRVGGLEIDILHRRVRQGDVEVHLTALELSLLYLLAANPGRVLTRDEILTLLWGAEHVVESNVVDRHVGSLRAKLRDHSHGTRHIETVPGLGYRFRPIGPRADTPS